MFKCPACGAGMRFDPESQKMKCDYCDTIADLSELNNDGYAEEDNDLDVTIYTCPSCGASLGSVETSAAEFCSFCGASVVLEGRLDKIAKPDYIIPFKKSMEDCKKSLSKHLKMAFFVPNDFKNASIENIRGIYMPYWNYHVEQKGDISLNASKYSHHKKDYDYYDDFRLDSDIDAEYDGIPHDASGDFADRMSEALEPYDYRSKKGFNSGYMAGFYADIKDVNPGAYSNDAIILANQKAKENFIDKSKFNESEISIFNADSQKLLTNTFNTKVTGTDCTMVPVWFMAYRQKDRVAYAAINGETGKVVSDMPLDMKKIWMMIPILAIPIFFILNMFLSVTAKLMLNLAVGLSGVAGVLSLVELNLLKKQDKNRNTTHAVKKTAKKKKSFSFGELIVVLLIISVAFSTISGAFLIISTTASFLPFIFAIAVVIYGFAQAKKHPKDIGAEFESRMGYISILASTVIAGIVVFVNPVRDIFYYIAAFFPFAAVIYNIWRILSVFNLFTTRPLPQLGRREKD